MTYFSTYANFNDESLVFPYSAKINYLMPYLPSSGEKNYDENDINHSRHQNNSIKIYNSKYRDSKAYYYLFQDLNSGILNFLRDHSDIQYVIPVGSTHPLVYEFAKHVCSKINNGKVINCLQKQERRIFNFIPIDAILLEGKKVLLVDDVITSSETMKNAVQILKNSTNLSYSDIEMLCIGKTTRDLIEWDSNFR